jgi:2-polyprenyl-3-methyl-5-hydroxy-6-metoxy-1,4-benzoquinol methylase
MSTATAVRERAPAFNPARAEAFIGKFLAGMNNAAMILMISVGHRTGLFDKLAEVSPATSAELAKASGQAERYVREWLSVMATSGVVDYDPADRRFTLPAEHAGWLTRAAAPNNVAANAQFISVIAGVEDEIVEHFGDGHGVHYHEYGRFHEVMGEHTGQNIVMNLIEHVLPLAEGSIGALERGIDVVDVGCGAGGALLLLAEKFPRSRFTGIDLCTPAFEQAEGLAIERGLHNLKFQELDIGTVTTLGAYDLVLAFDAVHDQRDPQEMLRTVRRSLKPGGTYLMVDIGGSSKLENNMDHPLGAYLYAVSTMHCTPVSLAQGGIGLGTMWGVELASEMLFQAGFGKVAMTRLPHDPFNAYFVARV